MNIVLTDVYVRVDSFWITSIQIWITKDISCRLDEDNEEKHLDMFVCVLSSRVLGKKKKKKEREREVEEIFSF